MAVSKAQSRPSQFLPDERQHEAIEHVGGPMLVVAGAGTGKTSVLTQRISRLVSEGHARPDEILALTYTLNAAAEMRDRVRSLLGGKEVRAATFHDYCFQLLGRHEKKFGVLDEKDLWIYLRKRLPELGLQYFVRAANVSQFLNELLEFLSRCHDELVTPEKYAEYVQRVECGDLPVPRVAKSKEELSDAEVVGRCREISRVFTLAERWLREENLGTFSHMITGAHKLLTSDAACLAAEQAAARFILVDEFQDANFAQIKILSALAGEQGNVFAVGDPDQAIYRFRGASSAAFQLFRRDFPTAKLVVLGKNRRSTTGILRNAFAIIDKNPPVFGTDAAGFAYRRTPLESARDQQAADQGKTLQNFPVEAVAFSGKDAEGPDVVSVIEEVHRRLRCKWKNFGVLYRIGSHRDDVVQQLAKKDIPFLIEGLDVSDTPEVRDLFACVAVIVDAGDDASLFRVAALPGFKVDGEQLRTTLRRIAKEAREGDVIPLATVLGEVAGGRDVLNKIFHTRDELNRRQAKGRQALEIIAQEFALETGSPIVQAALKFVGDWETKPKTETRELRELIEYLGYFREAAGVIPMASDEDDDAVRLMTVHTAKGLEFDHVFILRATKPSFPGSYREKLVEFPQELRDPDSASLVDDKTLFDQEERRLFYVAMTRARDSLHIYGKQGTGKDKTPPGFMRDLMKDSSVGTWLRQRPALPSQPELIEISAGADPAYAHVSRTTEWLELPPIDGLASRLSASAVDTYERCPLQFKLEREWKLSREVPAAMQYGASMHRILKTYFDAIKLGRPKTDAELLALFREDLAAAGIQDSYQHSLYEAQGIRQLTEFLAMPRSSADEVLHTEEWFDVQVGGTKLTGRIDRIDRTPDGGVAIVDYKTGKARSQDDADESLQLSIYALAAREKWGYHAARLAFFNLEGSVAVTTRRSDFELEQTRERVEAAARAIGEGKFDPKPDFHCNFCSFRGLCPAKEKRIPIFKMRENDSSD